jgi:hypothetical protein
MVIAAATALFAARLLILEVAVTSLVTNESRTEPETER